MPNSELEGLIFRVAHDPDAGGWCCQVMDLHEVPKGSIIKTFPSHDPVQALCDAANELRRQPIKRRDEDQT